MLTLSQLIKQTPMNLSRESWLANYGKGDVFGQRATSGGENVPHVMDLNTCLQMFKEVNEGTSCVPIIHTLTCRTLHTF